VLEPKIFAAARRQTRPAAVRRITALALLATLLVDQKCLLAAFDGKHN
jgi:hypothetical protein